MTFPLSVRGWTALAAAVGLAAGRAGGGYSAGTTVAAH
jgi:hypothetical protein